MQRERSSGSRITSRRKFLAGGAALAAFVMASRLRHPSGAAESDPDLVHAFTDSLIAFGRDFYAALPAGPANLVYSPYSIGTAMAMVTSGARGNTEKELAKVLRLRMTRQEIEEASAKVMAILNGYDTSRDPHFCPHDAHWTGAICEASPSEDLKCRPPLMLQNDRCAGTPLLPYAQVLVANALMLAKYGDLVSKDYRALVQDRYGAELFSDVTLDQVNDWVKQKTKGKIARILDTMGDDPVMVLLNAIYFKAAWETPFSKSATRDADFNLSREKTIKAPMMFRESDFSVLARSGFRAITLPYSSTALAMAVVLPDKVDGLSEVVQSLDASGIAKLLSELRSGPVRRVALSLPKFKCKSELDCVPPLQFMGLRLALSDHADFRGIVGDQSRDGVKIGQIRHSAEIEVAEEGTEAAAATAIAVIRASARRPQEPAEAFVVDRPFLFLIADAASGAVLFQGRVADPSLPA